MVSRRSGDGWSFQRMLAVVALGWLASIWLAVDSSIAGPTASAPTPSDASESEQFNDRLAALIKDLGSQEYLARQFAQEELRRLGPAAFDALAASEDDGDIEIASRVRYLLQTIRVEWVRDGDSPIVKQILHDYEFESEAQRAEHLGQLAGLPQEVGLQPLCRLVRFEQSPLVSKQGALLVLRQKVQPDPAWQAARQKIIQTSLAGSLRPGARWVLAARMFESDLPSALDHWQRLVDAELAALNDLPTPSELEVVQGLQQYYAEMLYRQSLPDRAKQVVAQMIERSADDAESLGKLVDWLVEQRALDMIDLLAHRFEHRLKSSPDLLLAIAQARRSQGQEQAAEELVARASKLFGDDAQQHLRAAYLLQTRGMFDWSESEYRGAIAVASRSKESMWTIRARIFLAELLFDLEREYDAAEELRKLNDLMASDREVMDAVQELGREKHVPAHMHYYYACHDRKRNELTKMREHLDRAIEHDPGDADILIALYRDSTANSKRRNDVKARIIRLAEESRNEIAQFSTEEPRFQANPYNQYAWLIGNTEGNLDLALQYSHKSLEIMPDTAGFLDTLAHCYAAKKDFKNAVHYQSRAAELEPHAMVIQRALARFKAELEKPQ
ncbi:MAG: hypothetical protein IT427_13195 [Pirellulales bacterium]|nr:hypothetical protein [Pirellulales bacterium]